MKKIFNSVLIMAGICLFSQTQAHCEYSLATGQQEDLLISTEKEVSMGRSLSKQVEEKIKVDDNYTYQERVDVIGQKLASVCDRRDIVYHFKVLRDEEDSVNAFALPGGYIYVFRGLVSKMDSDDEIAAVLAHEMGHICARHAIKRLQSSLGYEIMRFLAMRAAQDNYTRYKANEAINQLMMSYSRQDELEADRLSVRYMEKAGYKPDAMLSVIDTLLKIQMEGPVKPKRYWYTHPYLAARKAAAEQEITGQMDFDGYINMANDETYVSN